MSTKLRGGTDHGRSFLWSSDRKRELYAPPADAPVEQLTAYVAMEAFGLAAHVAGADLGDAYRNLLRAYEQRWETP